MMNLITIVMLAVFLYSKCILSAPVYKILLSQKKQDQFLQYEIEVPPLFEFTFCTWVRFNEFEHNQSIFTYIVDGSKSVLNLWLESGGKYLKVKINEKVSSAVPIEIEERTWRHMCLSYQAEYGAWAIYINSHLVLCEATPDLHKYVIPGNGTFILGNGISDGNANGLEGEIFGASMILISTIDSNRANPVSVSTSHGTRSFKNNAKVVERNIKDQTDNKKSLTIKKYPFNLHNIAIEDFSSLEQDKMQFNNTKDIIATKENFWYDMKANSDMEIDSNVYIEQSGSSTQELPTVSEFEMPPPPKQTNVYVEENLQIQIPPKPLSTYEANLEFSSRSPLPKHSEELSIVETPPPLKAKDNKVYGQWSFSDSVLKYLKSPNFKVKTPPTIPQIKISDSFPYPSTTNSIKVKPPLSLLPHYRITETNKFNERSINTRLRKRDLNKKPQINVRIFHDNLRENILNLHANVMPRKVEITSRGMTGHIDKLFWYDLAFRNNYSDYETIENATSDKYDVWEKFLFSRMTPFFISTQYLPKLGQNFTRDSHDILTDNISDSNAVYINTLSHMNTWRNAKPLIGNSFQNSNVTNIIDINKFKSSHWNSDRNDSNLFGNKDTDSLLKIGNYVPVVQNYITSTVPILNPYSSIGMRDNSNKNQLKLTKSSHDLNRLLKTKDVRQLFNTPQAVDVFDTKLDQLNSKSLTKMACNNLILYDDLYSKQTKDTTYISTLIKGINSGFDFIFHSHMMCSLESFEANSSHIFLFQWNFTPVKVIGEAQPKRFTFCDFYQ